MGTIGLGQPEVPAATDANTERPPSKKTFHKKTFHEVRTEQREAALDALVRGKKVPWGSSAKIAKELRARAVAPPELWAAMSPDERRSWLVTDGDAAIEAAEQARKETDRANKAAAEQERRDRLEQERAKRRDRLEQEPAIEAPTPKVEVVRYKTTAHYERDAQRRLSEGWVLSGQSQEAGQTHRLRGAITGGLLGSFIMMPATGAVIGGLRGKRDPGVITITWTKPPAVIQGPQG